VKSRLSKSIDFWEHIGASKFILNTLKHGYVIPFICTPPPMKFKNNKSAIENNVFVDEAVSELINNGCIQEVPFQPFVVNPLSVAIQKSGKKRLILDLSELNVYVAKNKIKFEDWKVALQFFERDCYMFKFDLTSGYFHLDICIEQQTYLGFSWNNKFYCFSVLAFGLTSAPYIFTKCLRPMVKYWRENGVNIVLYLDDGFGLAGGYLECKNKSDFVKLSLKQTGFLVNEGKSIFEPIQCLEWLGLIWDSKAFSLKIPERRISDTIESLEKLLKLFPYISARQLAQFTGRVISMSPVMGNVTSLMTRHLYFAIESRRSWDSRLKFSDKNFVFEELLFWSGNLCTLNQNKLLNDSLPCTIVYSDASNVAGGAYTVEMNEKVFHQMWDEFEKNMSSTWRELRAIYLPLHSFKSELQNKRVKWHTDNQNCINIINKGSTTKHLQYLAYDIFLICSNVRITLNPIWIPRSENCKADFI